MEGGKGRGAGERAWIIIPVKAAQALQTHLLVHYLLMWKACNQYCISQDSEDILIK